MAFEDTQVDLLLRRYGRDTKSQAAAEHLDADEINAFAEGSLPAAARARCVSHLAECNECRGLASQLAISAGAVMRSETFPAASASRASWLQGLIGLFRLPTLRYAAFAAALIAAVGIAFLAVRQTRRQPESALVAQNEPAMQRQSSSIKESEEATKTTEPNGASTDTTRAGAPTHPTPNSNLALTQEESKSADKSVAPAKPQKETAEPTSLAGKPTVEPEIAESKPAYAPPPPGETERQRLEKSREQQTLGAGGPSPAQQKSESPQNTRTGNLQRGVFSNENRTKDDGGRVGVAQSQVSKRAADEKAKGPRRDVDNVAANRNATEPPSPAEKNESAGTGNRAGSDEAPETRSVGGHKFRRQGAAWIDAKFKSSMALKNIARGSEEFAALDSGLRSIAQQLGGEVIIVKSGKAYRIK